MLDFTEKSERQRELSRRTCSERVERGSQHCSLVCSLTTLYSRESGVYTLHPLVPDLGFDII